MNASRVEREAFSVACANPESASIFIDAGAQGRYNEFTLVRLVASLRGALIVNCTGAK